MPDGKVLWCTNMVQVWNFQKTAKIETQTALCGSSDFCTRMGFGFSGNKLEVGYLYTEQSYNHWHCKYCCMTIQTVQIVKRAKDVLQIDLLSCFLIWQQYQMEAYLAYLAYLTCAVDMSSIPPSDDVHFNKSQQNIYIIVLSMLTFSILQNIEVQCTIFLVNANLDLFVNLANILEEAHTWDVQFHCVLVAEENYIWILFSLVIPMTFNRSNENRKSYFRNVINALQWCFLSIYVAVIGLWLLIKLGDQLTMCNTHCVRVFGCKLSLEAIKG